MTHDELRSLVEIKKDDLTPICHTILRISLQRHNPHTQRESSGRHG